jgi:hypothetical protein
MKLVYYAHPVSTYNTPQEKRDLETLEAMGLRVVNPNTPEIAEKYQTLGMPMFEEMVKGSDVLAFKAFADGSIGAGVAKEIEWARSGNGRPIIELPTCIQSRTLTVEESREFLRDSGNR